MKLNNQEELNSGYHISNNGHQTLYNVTISHPTLSWISLITNDIIGDIVPGSVATFELMIYPSENVSIGVYNDNIIIKSNNYDDLTLPINVILTSDQVGDLQFTVKNQLGDVIPSAEIIIIDQETNTLIYTQSTDSNGQTLFVGIPTGRYSYRVSASYHYDRYGTKFVEIGMITKENVIMEYTFLQIEWIVLPTIIPDKYEIIHNITYDSTAPIPYIKSEIDFDLVYMVPNSTYYGNITLTNMNDIVSVYNGTPHINSPSELITLEFLVDNIPELKPNENITIPFAVKLAEHHSPSVKSCNEYCIMIDFEWDGVCLYTIIFPDGREKEVWRNSITNPEYLCIRSSTLDIINDIIGCTGIDIPYKIYYSLKGFKAGWNLANCLEVFSDCKLNEKCGLQKCFFDAKACIDFIKILSPIGSCASAVFNIVTKKYQDECCIEPSGPLIPPDSPPIYDLDDDGPPDDDPFPPKQYTPSPYKIGNCSNSPETMCTQAKLEIYEELTLERQAFDAMLKLKNTMPAYDMTNVSITIDITDSNGNLSNDMFFTSLVSKQGINSVTDGIIDADSEATMRWLIIPKPGAGGTKPNGESYTVDALIEYKVNSIDFYVTTWPEDIQVLPMPILTLDYMLPKTVYGDNPMTQEIIEPAESFMWGVRVKNIGYGPAHHLTIDSSQPQIKDVTTGFNIDFKILGTYLNGNINQDTLKIDFGNIPPDGYSTAAWEMICSVTGNFTNYTASYTHSDSLGGEATSLIQEVNTYILIHEFINDMPGEDNMFDFLIDVDDDGIPDYIIDSLGNDKTITKTDAEIIEYPSESNPTAVISINKTIRCEWIYVEIDDPCMENHTIESIIRARDGKVLNQHNYWLRNDKIYLVDDPEDLYIIKFEFEDITPPNRIPVADINGPYKGLEGSVITFNATTSYDSDGDELQYRLDFDNDGFWDTGYSTDPIASNTWNDDYNGIVKVEVSDGEFTDIDTAIVNVTNVAPITNTGLDQVVEIFNTVYFDGSFVDPGILDTHNIIEWDFGDGKNTSGILNPMHVYNSLDIFTVTLNVTDDDGGVGSDTLIVIVVDTISPTTLKTVNQPKYGNNDLWVTSYTEVNLTASDVGVGVNHTYYRIWYNDEWDPLMEYNGNFTLTGEGFHYLEYFSIDLEGNSETVHNQTHNVDDSSPSIEVIVPAQDEALQDGVTFEALVTDQVGVDWVNMSIRTPGGDQGIIIDAMYESMLITHIGDGIWQLTFDTTQLPDGYYLLFVEASDMLDNQGYVTVDFSIRNWAVIELLPSPQNHKAGRTMPVKFSLRIAETVDPEQPFVRNEELNILIYEEGFPETILQNSTYGNTSTDYRINSTQELYITNFKTMKKPKTYVVEIWRKDMLLDSFEFETVK